LNESPIQVVLVPLALTGWRKVLFVSFQLFIVIGLMLSVGIMVRALMLDLDISWGDIKKAFSKLAFWKRKRGPIMVQSPAQGGNQ